MGAANLPQISNGSSRSGDSFDEGGFDRLIEPAEFGAVGSFRHLVLSTVLEQDYEGAIKILEDFLAKPSEFPNFQAKIKRHIRFSIDLIYAIKAKRGFPGIDSLTRAKQQELRDKFKEHFKELKHTLALMEQVQGNLRSRDARATIIVINAAWVSVFVLLIMALWMDLRHGLAETTLTVLDDIFGIFANWLGDKLGF